MAVLVQRISILSFVFVGSHTEGYHKTKLAKNEGGQVGMKDKISLDNAAGLWVFYSRGFIG